MLVQPYCEGEEVRGRRQEIAGRRREVENERAHNLRKKQQKRLRV